MNKHQTYWSVMGNEPQDKSIKREDLENLEKQLKIMFNKYDKDEVLTLIRKTYEEVL